MEIFISHKKQQTVSSHSSVSLKEILKVGESVFPLTLNPFNIKRDVEYRISSLIFEPFIKFEWNGEVKPVVLATSPDNVSSVKIAWKIRIKNTIKWSDNTPFTSEDVIYTLKRIKCSKHAYANIFKNENPELISDEIKITFPDSMLETYENIKYFRIPVIKNKTLGRCNCSDSYASESKHFFSTSYKKNVIGTGPYVFDQYNDTFHKIIFTSNKHYRNYQPDTSFKIIEVLILTNNHKLAKDGFANERKENTPYLDIDPTVPFNYLKQHPENVRVFSNLSNDVYLLGFNYESENDSCKLLKNKTFRKALIYSLKVSTIFDFDDDDLRPYLKLRSAPLGYEDAIDEEVSSEACYKYGDEEPINVLKDFTNDKGAKYENGLICMGKRVNYSLIYRKWIPDSEKAVEQIVLQLNNHLNQLGVFIVSKGISFKDKWDEAIKKRNFDMIYTAIHLGRDKNFFPYFDKDSSQNIFGYNDDQFQKYVNNYKYSSLIMKSTALVDANQYLCDDIAAIFLWKRNYVGVVRKDVVTGPEDRLDVRNLFENISEWKIRDTDIKE
jgi:ABC-type transport system substrate-binding protein